MKRFNYICGLKYLPALFAILLLMTQACERDYLDRAPSDYISEEQVFNNLDNAEGFFDNAYNAIPDIFKPGGDDNWMLCSGSDEAEQIWDIDNDLHDADANYFNTGASTPSKFPLYAYWSNYYSAIRIINIFLANYDRIPDPAPGEAPDRKTTLRGEAHALRAYYYFELYKMWGKVPLIDKPVNAGDPESNQLQRSSIDDVVSFIKDEIAAAIPDLAPNNFTATSGYATSRKWGMDVSVCKALLSRVQLYYASPLSNPGNDASRWQAAATASKDALDFALAHAHPLNTSPNGGYPAYEGIFVDNAQPIPEIIWGRAPVSGNWWETVTQSNRTASGLSAWYGTAPTVEMMNAYEMADGKAITDAGSGYDPQHPFANRDPRLTQSIVGQGQSWRGATCDVRPGQPDYKTDHPTTNLFLKKFMNSGSSYPTRTWIIFRTAELYLNYAEAQNEAAGPDQSVYDAVNAIRSRAGMPDLPAGLSKDQMRQHIRHERRIELAFEEHRFWDVRRWKIAMETGNKSIHKMEVASDGTVTYPILEGRTFRPKDYLFPIPQSEYDKNPALGQNPGW